MGTYRRPPQTAENQCAFQKAGTYVGTCFILESFDLRTASVFGKNHVQSVRTAEKTFHVMGIGEQQIIGPDVYAVQWIVVTVHDSQHTGEARIVELSNSPDDILFSLAIDKLAIRMAP